MQSVKRKRFILSRILIATLVLVESVSITGCESEARVQLAENIYSGASVSDIQALLASADLEWTNIETTELDSADSRPPYHLEVWETNGLVLADSSGTAWFKYFNGELVSIEFYPDNPERFDKSKVRSTARVTTGKNYAGRHYFRFEDRGRQGAIDAWVMKYS